MLERTANKAGRELQPRRSQNGDSDKDGSGPSGGQELQQLTRTTFTEGGLQGPPVHACQRDISQRCETRTSHSAQASPSIVTFDSYKSAATLALSLNLGPCSYRFRAKRPGRIQL